MVAIAVVFIYIIGGSLSGSLSGIEFLERRLSLKRVAPEMSVVEHHPGRNFSVSPTQSHCGRLMLSIPDINQLYQKLKS